MDQYKSEWNKIIIARVAEGILMAGSFVVGIWYTSKSKKLEEKLDAYMNDDGNFAEDEDYEDRE